MKTVQIPPELDIVRTRKGFTMHGWDFSSVEVRHALAEGRMLNPTFELASNVCPWNCFFCFTEDPGNPEGLKKKLAGEMDLRARLRLLEEAHQLGARSINIVGAGEPTVDPNFWRILEEISNLGMVPIVYTEGALRLTDEVFAKRLYEIGATVVLKVNSLSDEGYQNSVVSGGKRRERPLKVNYFEERNRALENLIRIGFNSHDPTRLAFDTIVCRENWGEIERVHRFARERNIFVLFVGYLPSGRSSKPIQNAVSREELFGLFERLAEIDKVDYGIEHRSIFPYAGGVPCTLRGLGLHVKITGEVFDCVGETKKLGNFKEESLREMWERASVIRRRFDGRCEPREMAWKKARIGAKIKVSS